MKRYIDSNDLQLQMNNKAKITRQNVEKDNLKPLSTVLISTDLDNQELGWNRNHACLAAKVEILLLPGIYKKMHRCRRSLGSQGEVVF